MGSIFRKGSADTSASGRTSSEQADIARRQTALAEEQAALTRPLRQGSAGILQGFLETGNTPGFLDLNPTVQPLAALGLGQVGSEQQLLRNTLLAQGNRGGQLQQQLGNAAIQGGLQRTGLMQQDLLRQQARDEQRTGIRQTLFGGASDMGTGGLAMAFQGLGQGMAGLGNAASNLNSLGAQRIQQNQAAQQGIGQLLGKVVGGAAGGMAGGPMGAQAGSRIGSGQAGGMK